MAKSRKLKLHSQGKESMAEQGESWPAPSPEAGLEPTNPERTSPMSLADIRASALKAHMDAAHTIADLEAWRAEIDATIAFLKARSR
jgi:hypothetical protein